MTPVLLLPGTTKQKSSTDGKAARDLLCPHFQHSPLFVYISSCFLEAPALSSTQTTGFSVGCEADCPQVSSELQQLARLL